MNCQNCHKRPANVHIVQSTNGNQTEIYLCDYCAKGIEVMNMQIPNSFGNFNISFEGLLPNFIAGNLNFTPVRTTSCPQCNMTFEDFQKIGKLGCGKCYETFFLALTPVISRIHGNVEYKGKMPLKTENIRYDNSELDKLKSKLKEAITNEEYEKAAQIRDEIRNLETKSDA